MLGTSAEELATKAAKDITVSAVSSNSDCPISSKGGENVVDFYNAIYKGLIETLKKTSFTN